LVLESRDRNKELIMTFEQRVAECLEQTGIPFEQDGELVLVSREVGADAVFAALKDRGGFYHMPTVLEVE